MRNGLSSAATAASEGRVADERSGIAGLNDDDEEEREHGFEEEEEATVPEERNEERGSSVRGGARRAGLGHNSSRNGPAPPGIVVESMAVTGKGKGNGKDSLRDPGMFRADEGDSQDASDSSSTTSSRKMRVTIKSATVVTISNAIGSGQLQGAGTVASSSSSSSGSATTGILRHNPWLVRVKGRVKLVIPKSAIRFTKRGRGRGSGGGVKSGDDSVVSGWAL